MFVGFGFYLKHQDRGSDILLQAITGNLSYFHYDPVELNDEFSEKAFELYLNNIDPTRRFLTSKDSVKLAKYRTKIDDEIQEGTYKLFDLSVELLEERQQQVEKYIEAILQEPFDFSAVEEVQFSEDLPFVKNESELKERWRKYLKYNTLTRVYDDIEAQKKRKDSGFVAVEADSLERKARANILRTHKDWLKRLNRMDRKEHLSVYANSITAVYDPHTNYFPPKDKANFDISMTGKLEGIGAQLQEKDGYIKVTSVIAGGPASLQGDLKEGDLILKVAQQNEEPVDIVDWKIDEAVKLIRGKKGTVVTLTVRRPDGSQKEIKITRDVVVLEETYAKSLVLNNSSSVKAGYVFLPSFYADFENPNGRFSWKDVRSEIEKLKEEGVKGIIIDLRNNGGGSLDDVINIAGLFIDEGPVVQVKEKNKRARVMRDERFGIEWNGPLVIMVNEFSASASEILAAAMQDYGRAVILGSAHTHGKGTVQRFLNLNQTLRAKDIPQLGHIKFTTQKFYRINGDATQLKGVTSDVIAPDFYMYLETGEKEHDYPMAWDQIESSSYLEVGNVPKAVIDQSTLRVSSSETFQMIEQNARRWEQQQDEQVFPLNWDQYTEMRTKRKAEDEQYGDILKSPIEGFLISNTSSDKEHIASDSSRSKRNEDWVNGVSKDPYIYEALLIVQDWYMQAPVGLTEE